jgi:hypothetical protein
MAINWKASEAIVKIQEGDKEAIQDIGKRFPLFANLAAKVQDQSAVEILSACPDYLTVRKIEDVLKNGVKAEDEASDASEDDAEAEDEKPVKTKAKVEKATTAETEDDDNDYESKSSQQLYKILASRGLTKGKRFSKKADMIEALKADDAKSGGADVEDETEAETEDYSEMTAMDLFKLCKKRGIKAEPKQKASVYIKLLEKADEAMNEPEDDDDWGDEEDEKPVEKPKKEAKAEKKSKPKKEEFKEDDDDDDWDI